MKYAVTAILAAAALLAAGCDDGGGGNGDGGASLAGTRWGLTSWSAGAPSPSGYDITAEFDGSRISGRAAVNSYGGAYAAGAAGTFSAGPLESTLMAGSADAMQVESTYFALLERARRYVVDSSTLQLLDGPSVLLVFDRQ